MKEKQKKKIATAAMIIKGIPVSLRSHFRAWCALRNLTMKEVLTSLMREKINERIGEK